MDTTPGNRGHGAPRLTRSAEKMKIVSSVGASCTKNRFSILRRKSGSLGIFPSPVSRHRHARAIECSSYFIQTATRLGFLPVHGVQFFQLGLGSVDNLKPLVDLCAHLRHVIELVAVSCGKACVDWIHRTVTYIAGPKIAEIRTTRLMPDF
jgi:hypothetical protein